ncbi:Chloroplast envelope membrane 70 kDa heat shock-related protein, partial [Mucuna pruriens]
MISEAKKYKVEDVMYRKKVEVRHSLEQHAYNMKNAIEHKEIKKEEIYGAIECTCQWLQVNMDVKLEDIDNMRSNLASVFDPIIVKMINGVPPSAIGSSSNKNEKKHWLKILAKFALKGSIFICYREYHWLCFLNF